MTYDDNAASVILAVVITPMNNLEERICLTPLPTPFNEANISD